jgi:hypothetical protein
VEHSNTAVYFCEGMHNNRQFALKFYASQADFTAEMMAYKELGGELMSVMSVMIIITNNNKKSNITKQNTRNMLVPARQTSLRKL